MSLVSIASNHIYLNMTFRQSHAYLGDLKRSTPGCRSELLNAIRRLCKFPLSEPLLFLCSTGYPNGIGIYGRVCPKFHLAKIYASNK